jgi:mannosyltransferase
VRKPPRPRLSRNAFRVAVALETALAATLGFIFLGSKSFSGDEAVTIVLARLPWPELSHLIAKRETNGAFYFMTTHALTHGHGGEVALRSLSVVCATLSVPLLALLTRRLFGAGVGVIAGLVFALNPLQVEYAQVAREYVLAVFLVVVSTYAFVRGVQEQERWPWIVYAPASALAVYVFLFAAIVPLMHALSLAAKPRAEVPWRRWAVASGAAAVLALPMVVLLARSRASSGVAWAAGNLPGRFVVSIRSAFPRALVDVVVVLVVGALAVLVCRALVRNAHRPWLWPAALVTLWLVGSFVLVSAAGFILQPLFVARYFLVFMPPIAIGVALLLVRLRRKVAVAVAALLVVASGVGLARWYSSDGSDYRAASNFVASQSRSNDGVLIYAPYVRVPFELYFPRVGAGNPVYPSTPWGCDSARFIEYVPMPTAAVDKALAGYTRVWVVLSDYQLYGNRDPGYHHVVAALASRGFRLAGQRAFAGVDVRRYVRG